MLANGFICLYCISSAKSSAEVYCRYRYSYTCITTVADTHSTCSQVFTDQLWPFQYGGRLTYSGPKNQLLIRHLCMHIYGRIQVVWNIHSGKGCIRSCITIWPEGGISRLEYTTGVLPWTSCWKSVILKIFGSQSCVVYDDPPVSIQLEDIKRV